MNNNYFEKCHLLMNKLSKLNKQMIKLQVDFEDLKKENKQLKEENMELQGKVSSWKITASEEISEKVELIKQIAELKEENKKLEQIVFDYIKRIYG